MSLTVADTRPDLTGTCSNTDPITNVTTAANITGSTLALHIRRGDGTSLTKVGSIVSGPAGTWSYRWIAGDLTVAGAYRVEVQVTFSDGGIQTFGPATIYVKDELG
jgi:hypothetical protein